MELKDSSTEKRILEAAKTVFMLHGLYGARMQDIANTAGINKALLHYYFRSKEKLFDSVFDGALSKYFEQMTVFSDLSLPIEERIYKYIDSLFTFLSEYPQISMFILKEISTNEELFQEKVDRIKSEKGIPLITALREAIKKGEIRAIDPIIFFMNLHSLCIYPFLATPIFKAILKKNQEEWSEDSYLNLKQSVKEFVAFRLKMNQ